MTHRFAIVTGTTSGIGQAVARLLVEGGWRVLGVGRRASTISDFRYDHLQVDLHDLDALTRSMEPRLTSLCVGSPGCRIGLVNNAADSALLGPVAALDGQRLTDVFAVNVTAPIWLMGAVVRLAPATAAVRIVNVSSGAAVRAFPGLAAYGASKAALRMAAMVMATESEPTRFAGGLSIVSYEPGTVDTPMQAHARAQPTAVLPSVELFVRFAAEHQLVPPESPAREIMGFLEQDGSLPFTERRFGRV
jgi:NAD(P)-dependent dehydrogenase (short-subunit alcohol dehydrogenase family)